MALAPLMIAASTRSLCCLLRRRAVLKQRRVTLAVTEFSTDREAATEIADEIRAELGVLMDGAAQLSEFTVDFPLQARAPLTKEQWAVAVSLNTLATCWTAERNRLVGRGNPDGRAFPTLQP
jgi:hypothetical protein